MVMYMCTIYVYIYINVGLFHDQGDTLKRLSEQVLDKIQFLLE